MRSYIVTVSPKGQITIPVAERCKHKHKKYLLTVKHQNFLLQPVELRVVEDAPDEADQFSAVGISSFDFWNTPKDDIYQNFYEAG